jgi:hypothetical protein
VVYFTLLFHYTLKECSLHYKILITPKRGVLNHKKKFCGPVGLVNTDVDGCLVSFIFGDKDIPTNSNTRQGPRSCALWWSCSPGWQMQLENLGLVY